MRADEVEPGDRIRHPHCDQIVEVTGRVDRLNRTQVKFKAKGQRGWFDAHPHRELEDCT